MNRNNEDSKKTTQPPRKRLGEGRIVTMDSIRNSQQDERQAYFAGGSEHSGQQILGRGKRRNEDSPDLQGSGDALAAAFRRASATSGVPASNVSYHNEPTSFSGIGHRLGDTDGEPTLEQGDAPELEDASQFQDEEAPTHVVVTLWENGFNIDDGPLHSYDDPECAELMENIERGELPSSIIPYDRNPIHLSVVDKRNQKFKESVKVFGGKGHMLGSPTPSVIFDGSSESSRTSKSSMKGSVNGQSGGNALHNAEKKTEHYHPNMGEDNTGIINLDDEDDSVSSNEAGFNYFDYGAQETSRVFGGQGHILESGSGSLSSGSATSITTIESSSEGSTSSGFQVKEDTDFSDSENKIVLKIRLPDGQTVQIKVNATAFISEVKEMIKKCVNGLLGRDFSLQLTYPRRDLQDAETVDSSEINKSVLVLRF